MIIYLSCGSHDSSSPFDLQAGMEQFKFCLYVYRSMEMRERKNLVFKSLFSGVLFKPLYIYIYIVGDRLKPRNSVFPVLRKTKNCFKNSVLIETYQVFNTCTIVSTYVCCYDFSWRKRVSYERFLLEHEDTCFLSLTPDP